MGSVWVVNTLLKRVCAVVLTQCIAAQSASPFFPPPLSPHAPHQAAAARAAARALRLAQKDTAPASGNGSAPPPPPPQPASGARPSAERGPAGGQWSPDSMRTLLNRVQALESLDEEVRGRGGAVVCVCCWAGFPCIGRCMCAVWLVSPALAVG